MKRILTLSIVVWLAGGISFARTEARLLRFPTIHENRVVFCYGGDLYTVAAKGGVARRLTSHEGYEMFPRFSPDGKKIAFTGQYDGNTEVFLVDADGGVPIRLTYTATLDRDDVSDRMGPNNIVMGWTSDGKNIVFRSRMTSFNSFIGKLYTIPIEGGMPVEVPLPRGGFCSYSPDDTKLAYNRIFREFRTWKKYRGGMADDIWIHDFKTRETVSITDNPAQDIIPMWHGDRVYFLSDRDENGRMNLYVYDLNSKQTRTLTDFADFDIKFPSLGKKAIVFEQGGYLFRFDLETETSKRLKVYIQEDAPDARTALRNVSGNISNGQIAPDGKRALFGARGDVFTVPAEHGAIRNLTQTPGVHERNSTWSPDGKWIAYISDATGEDEIYLIPQDGSGPARQITKDADTYKYDIRWSPDSKKILWADKRQRLQYVDVESEGITQVDRATAWEMHNYAWSPDSQWIVYTRPEVETVSRIYLYSLDKKESYPITDTWYEADNAAFSSDGRFVFFVSNRDFNPIYSWTEWNHVYLDMARIYFVTLAKDAPSPFEPTSDEVQIKKDESKDDSEKKPDEKEKKAEEGKEEAKDEKATEKGLRVDIDGIIGRILALPIEASRYYNLTSVGDLLYYNRNGSKDRGSKLLVYDLKEKKETEIGSYGYEISADGKKMLLASGGRYSIIDLPKGKAEMGKILDLGSMEVVLDRRAEWNQIFHECWRQMREFFYVPNMHGVDWEAMREKYEPLVTRVRHRADLTYIIGEMIGELHAGHAYVGGGDYPRPARIKMGLLGATIAKDRESGYFRIEEILRGQNWDRSLRSPLTEMGVDANKDDYILAVNGKCTKEVSNLYELLINTAGRQVTLTLNEKPQTEGSRDVIVIPTEDESPLYYYQWVQGNIEKVGKATDGKVGYLHVPDMGPAGLNEFVKHFYPQLRKKALIVDVRGNGGGNVSPMLIERLRREAVMIDVARNGAPRVDPGEMLWGPMVCLCDEFSASDGDLFTFRFKQHKLGTVIGKRTWGGVVGIRGSLPLLDGGDLRKPEFSRYDLEGKEWIIEGYGVDPDIVVDNDPAQEYAGTDQQLNKAIEVILEQLRTQEKTIPPLPPYPVR
ncbi:MAG: PD40 domain-containing protein [Sedimentisphaerales bacterium]|nr:PD40 domain-containing protein [Sedimentisphaerales bacterium]